MRSLPMSYSQAIALLNLNPPIDERALKSAYRNAAKQHHPDLGGRHEDFIRINDAYNVVSFFLTSTAQHAAQQSAQQEASYNASQAWEAWKRDTTQQQQPKPPKPPQTLEEEFRDLLKYCYKRGLSPGFAAIKYREKRGYWPSPDLYFHTVFRRNTAKEKQRYWEYLEGYAALNNKPLSWCDRFYFYQFGEMRGEA